MVAHRTARGREPALRLRWSRPTGERRNGAESAESRRPLNLIRLVPAKEVEGDFVDACFPSRCLAVALRGRLLGPRADRRCRLWLRRVRRATRRPSSWRPTTPGRCRRTCSPKFEEKTGITVKVQPQGDAGQLTNKLVLTKDSPLADGVYGIDNTFASRAVDEGVLASYSSEALPTSAESFQLGGDAARQADAGRLQRRLRQRRRHVVRGEEGPAAEDARGPDRAGVQGPVRHARCHDLLARARLPARDDQRRGRRLAGLLEEADGQRRQGHLGLDRRLRGRLHRRWWERRAADRDVVLLLAAVHHPRGRDEADDAGPARHLLPPGGVRRGAEGLGEPRRACRSSSTSCSSGSSRRRCRTTCTSTRSTARVPLPKAWAKYAPVAPEAADGRPRRGQPRTAPSGCASGATSPASERSSGLEHRAATGWAPWRWPRSRWSRSPCSSSIPVAGMLARGFWPEGTFDPGAVLEVLGRPRVRRVLWFTLWSAGARDPDLGAWPGVPVAFVLHRLRFPGRDLLRAWSWCRSCSRRSSSGWRSGS